MTKQRLMPHLVKLACALGVGLAAASFPASAGETGWTISDVVGEVSITDADGAAIEPSLETVVPNGARVETGGDGQVSISRGRTVVAIDPKTDIEFTEDSEAGRVTIIQRLGEIFLDVEPRRRQHFQVDTPHLTAVVKGTQFVVAVAQSGSSVAVQHGAVEVTSQITGQSTLVGPTQRARVASDVLGRQWVQAGPAASSSNPGTGLARESASRTAGETRSSYNAPTSGSSWWQWDDASFDLWDLGEIGLTIAVALAAIVGILITVSDVFAARVRRLFGRR